MSSKELLIGRIKQNFDLERQECQQRDRKAEQEVRRGADEKEEDHQMRRLKRRCAKLERKLQEQETEIRALQDQQQLRFPLLMHETMRSLRSLESNQATSAAPLSHSVISDMAHDTRDVDARIYEYERQIAELYEENQQEKLKNDMLNECLRDQKHAKAKLMKACKHVKQQLQAAVEDSGLRQMLVDIEARCGVLEREKAQLMQELVEQRSLRDKHEAEQKIMTKQFEDLARESAKWGDIVTRKKLNLHQARDQICEQQQMIENLKTDLKRAEQRRARSIEDCHEHDKEEIERLQHTISVERTKYGDAQKCISLTTAEKDTLRQQLATRDKRVVFRDDVAASVDQDAYDRMLVQVRFIKGKVRALKNLVRTYEETNSIDISFFNQETCFQDDDQLDPGYAVELSESVFEASHNLSELQQLVEDVCARSMGSICALQ